MGLVMIRGCWDNALSLEGFNVEDNGHSSWTTVLCKDITIFLSKTRILFPDVGEQASSTDRETSSDLNSQISQSYSNLNRFHYCSIEPLHHKIQERF